MSEHLQCSVASAGIKTNSPGSCGVEGATGNEAESTLRAAGGGGVARCQRGGEKGKRESIMVWAKGRSLCWRLSNSVSPWEV